MLTKVFPAERPRTDDLDTGGKMRSTVSFFHID